MSRHLISLIIFTCIWLQSQAQVLRQKNGFDAFNQAVLMEYSQSGVSIATVRFAFDNLHNRISREVSITPLAYTRPFSIYGSVVSNAKLFHKPLADSLYWLVGSTDENGYVAASFAGGLQVGDSVLVLAAGYYALRVGVTAELLAQTHHRMPLFALLPYLVSNSIVNPSLRLLGVTGAISTTPTITVQLNAERNLVKYQLMRKDTTLQEINATGLQNVPYTLREGKNVIKAYFVGAGAIKDSISKIIYYYPPANLSAEGVANITFECDTTKFKSVNLYAGNTYLTTLQQPTTVVNVTRNSPITLNAFGYKRDTLVANQNRTYTVSLNLLAHQKDSASVNFPYAEMYPLTNMSLRSTGKNEVKVSRSPTDASGFYARNGLERKSEIYGISKPSPNADTLALYAVSDTSNFANMNEIYVGVMQNGTFKKILRSSFAANGISISPTEQLIKIDKVFVQKSEYTLLKAQALLAVPVTTFTTKQNRSFQLPFKALFVDKDSIKNDYTQIFTYDSTNVSIRFANETYTIKPKNCFVGTVPVSISATHDGLVTTTSFNVKIEAIFDTSTPIDYSPKEVCQYESVTAKIMAKSDTSLYYRLLEVATNKVISKTVKGTGDSLKISTYPLKNSLGMELFAFDSTTNCKLTFQQQQSVTVNMLPDTVKIKPIFICFGDKKPVINVLGDSIQIAKDKNFKELVSTTNVTTLPINTFKGGKTTFYARRMDKITKCWSVADTFGVTVRGQLVNLGTDRTLCYGEQLNLGNSVANTKSVWHDGDTTSTKRFNNLPVGTHLIWKDVTHLIEICNWRDSLLVTVLPPIKNNTLATSQSSYCSVAPPEEFIINGSLPEGGNGSYKYSYLLSDDGKKYRSAGDNKDLIITNFSDTLWVKRVVTSHTCTDTSKVMRIDYIENPKIQVVSGKTKQTILNGSTIPWCVYDRFPMSVKTNGKFEIFKNEKLYSTNNTFLMTVQDTGSYVIKSSIGRCETLFSFKVQAVLFTSEIENYSELYANPYFCATEPKIVIPKALPNASYSLIDEEGKSIGTGKKIEVRNSGSYRLVTTLNGCYDTSSVIRLNRLDILKAGIINPNIKGGKLIFCRGNGYVLKAANYRQEEGLSFTWYMNNDLIADLEVFKSTITQRTGVITLIVKRMVQLSNGSFSCSDTAKVYVEAIPESEAPKIKNFDATMVLCPDINGEKEIVIEPTVKGSTVIIDRVDITQRIDSFTIAKKTVKLPIGSFIVKVFYTDSCNTVLSEQYSITVQEPKKAPILTKIGRYHLKVQNEANYIEGYTWTVNGVVLNNYNFNEYKVDDDFGKDTLLHIKVSNRLCSLPSDTYILDVKLGCDSLKIHKQVDKKSFTINNSSELSFPISVKIIDRIGNTVIPFTNYTMGRDLMIDLPDNFESGEYSVIAKIRKNVECTIGTFLHFNKKKDNCGLITVTPNPNDGHFSITPTDTTFKGDWVLYSVTGQIISFGDKNNLFNKFNIEGVAKGVYFLKIVADKYTCVKKIDVSY